jgi:hypothetical protein
MNLRQRVVLLYLAAALTLFATIFCPRLSAQTTAVAPPTVLFIGNSFTFAANSPVHFYRAQSVTDLNGEGTGGVPALFKAFAVQAGREYAVSLETSPGKNFDFHVQTKAAVIGRAWDIVVAQGYSTLDDKNPGNPTLLVKTGKQLAELLRAKNPNVDIRLVATWSRADLTYPELSHWHGQPIEKMALDVRAGYDLLAASSPSFHSVIPVGEAWNRAIAIGFADPNPYDGIAPGQVDLWSYDHYHASAFGYYLSALMIFGDLTGLDPRSLGKTERTALELGFSADQTETLQKIAFLELSATKGRAPLKPFTPTKLTR